MAKKIVIANWKLNPVDIKEAVKLFSDTKRIASKFSKINVVVAPPAVYLSKFSVNKGNLFLGSQDAFWEKEGAFTGEVSSFLLSNLGVKYSILGHSERRSLGESDEVVRKKVRSSLDNFIFPIVCVGERERDSHGKYLDELRQQIKNSLGKIQKKDLSRIIIAYEPVWAIGKSSRDAINPEKLHEMVIFIRKILTDLFGRESAEQTTIIYGGSVDPTNAKDLCQKGEVSGFLVGGASLNPERFAGIIKSIQ